MEDFILREKITHFDHEKIQERIVHAKDSGANGFFELYKSRNKYTKGKFLNDTTVQTPLFVRFSKVAGGAGSTDMAGDVRSFSIKFYTQQGNYYLVGIKFPVCFIQHAMKFPVLIHAVKHEPDHGMPQAAIAHNTFWDFICLMPEPMHMFMWAMTDRAISRSLRMTEGFGVHNFKLINEQGKAHFVKLHWKPLLGFIHFAGMKPPEFLAKMLIFTAGICMKLLIGKIFLNGNWVCRLVRKKMNIHLNLICLIRQNSCPKN